MKTAENEKKNIDVEPQNIDKEVDDLVEELSSTPYEWTCKLSKSVTFGEITYEELHFNFGKLTAQDGIDIESELNSIGKPIYTEPAFDVNYLMRVAALACDEQNARNLIMKVSLADFVSIRTKTKLFLLKRAL